VWLPQAGAIFCKQQYLLLINKDVAEAKISNFLENNFEQHLPVFKNYHKVVEADQFAD
jgi:hypothetical protein